MPVERFLRNLFLISLAIFCVSFFKKDALPAPSEILSQSYREPVQTDTLVQPFIAKKSGNAFRIVPRYDYELYGLIVSEHISKVWWDYYHEEWNDNLNFKDIGVAWGDNLKNGVYQDIKFHNESWTLYWQPKSGRCGGTYSKFRTDQVSNNHLLSVDPHVSRAIMAASAGDQIYLKGYLVDYSHQGEESLRTTSTVRTDSGCEVIYVTDFKILKKASSEWRSLYKFLRFFVIICFALWFAAYYKKLSAT